jgi:hypothetical protein
VEANRFPAAGAVFWAEALLFGPPGRRAIGGPPPLLDARVTGALPDKITWRADPRGIVLLAEPVFYDHMPTPDELAKPPFSAPITVSGQVTSRDGRFHPRLFSVPLNADRVAYVALYRSTVTTRFDEAGGLAVRLVYADGAPAAWSVATLTCTRTGKTFTFSGQANQQGDLLVAMRGLPPPPASNATDQLTMTVVAPATHPQPIPVADPDALTARRLRLAGSGAFTDSVTIPFTRGQVLTATDPSVPFAALEA